MTRTGEPETLLLPPRLTASAELVRAAAEARGLTTVRLPGLAVPDGLRAQRVHAGPSFVDAVAPALGIGALEAPPGWLAGLPPELLRRDVELMELGEAHRLRRPVFVKTPNDKRIAARGYADGSRLPGADQLDPGTPVLVAELVRFTAEYRLFLLDGAVHTGSRYGLDGRLEPGPVDADAAAFGAEVAAAEAANLPGAVVVDVGRTDRGWAVIEANGAWGSGCYAADPDRVLDVVLAAAGPLARLAPRDRPFLRPAGGIRSEGGTGETLKT